MSPRRIAPLAALFAVALAGAIARAQTWSEIVPSSGPIPPARTNAGGVYDPVGHRLVVFGGTGASSTLNDVWGFDLAANVWTDLTPAAGPAPARRFTPNAVYDPVRHSMIVWSGQGAGFFNDVWEFDLSTHEWRQFMPAAPLPEIRYGTASIFDPIARDLVAFAGFTDLGRFDDTWRFSPDGVAWTDVSPAASPGRRCLHASAYDARQHRMIVYGGQRFGAIGDVWALDLATDAWTELTPATSPDPRWFGAGVYDLRFHRLMVFGGGSEFTSETNDVIAFDLFRRQWSTLAPAGTRPSARQGSIAIFVLEEDRLVVFGGVTASGVASDVWSLDGVSEAFLPGCLAGGIAAATSGPVDVLFVNGSAGGASRTVVVNAGDPLSLNLGVSPDGPARAPYVLFLWRNLDKQPTTLSTPAGRIVGCLVNHLQGPGKPWRCLRSSSLPAAACAGVAENPGPPTAPFARMRVSGLRNPVRLTIQAIVQDAGSASVTGFSPTNAIMLDVR